MSRDPESPLRGGANPADWSAVDDGLDRRQAEAVAARIADTDDLGLPLHPEPARERW